ncbi:hypothetical protein ACFL6M_02445 [Candidatus Eisenbacteria bacterium]|uniref:Uncharacterized protein n=1 Tax=Eiseniibacteriota bacterium TaxID=2212470 RepID=A0ABV6YJD9_UNCEI
MKAWTEIRNVAMLSSVDVALRSADSQETRDILGSIRTRVLASIPVNSRLLSYYEKLLGRLDDPVVCVTPSDHSKEHPRLSAICCPACHATLPTADVCRLQAVDRPVMCQICLRILYSDSFHMHEWTIDTRILRRDFLLLPDGVDLGAAPVFLDLRGEALPLVVDGSCLRNSSSALNHLGVHPGDRIRLRALSATKSEYALVPVIKDVVRMRESLSRVRSPGIGVVPTREAEDPGSPPREAPGIHHVTMDPLSLSAGTLRLPATLSKELGRSGTMQVQLVPIGLKKVVWREAKGRLHGLAKWFTQTALECGDEVCVRRWESPATLIIWTEWERQLDRLLKQDPEDLEWEQLCIRDCLLIVLSKLQRPAHYRELYAEVSRHKALEISSVEAALSRHKGVLFDLVSRGTWELTRRKRALGDLRGGFAASAPPVEEDATIVDQAVAAIRDEDMVYRILQAVRGPMSYVEICRRLAPDLGVNAELLAAQSFIDLTDPRLTRIDSGEWLLTEWLSEAGSAALPHSETVVGVAVGANPPVHGYLIDRVARILLRILTSVREITGAIVRHIGGKGD